MLCDDLLAYPPPDLQFEFQTGWPSAINNVDVLIRGYILQVFQHVCEDDKWKTGLSSSNDKYWIGGTVSLKMTFYKEIFFILHLGFERK